MKTKLLYLFAVCTLFACKNPQKKSESDSEKSETAQTQNDTTKNDMDSIPVMPVHHASFAMQLNGKTIYVDPVGDVAQYAKLPEPDFVLITHGHPDHFAPKTLEALVNNNTPILAPKAVKDNMSGDLQKQTQVMDNGDNKELMGIKIKAIPAYNLRSEAKKFHPKGKGNGYVLAYGGKRVYISGDTGDIPEMRNLKNIDVAFVCMNLPYTMPVDKAIDAVLDFKPKKVYPYHYRGNNGFSDVEKFKTEVEKQNPDIDVVLLNWYPDYDK